MNLTTGVAASKRREAAIDALWLEVVREDGEGTYEALHTAARALLAELGCRFD